MIIDFESQLDTILSDDVYMEGIQDKLSGLLNRIKDSGGLQGSLAKGSQWLSNNLNDLAYGRRQPAQTPAQASPAQPPAPAPQAPGGAAPSPSPSPTPAPTAPRGGKSDPTSILAQISQVLSKSTDPAVISIMPRLADLATALNKKPKKQAAPTPGTAPAPAPAPAGVPAPAKPAPAPAPQAAPPAAPETDPDSISAPTESLEIGLDELLNEGIADYIAGDMKLIDD